jgi:two-component system phosphate regulon sensor histidine kinase PhoR
MFKSFYFRRLFVPYFALICAVVVIVGLMGAVWFRQAYLDQRRADLRSTLLVVADELRLAGDYNEPLGDSLKRIAGYLDCRITVVAADQTGTVIADTAADAAAMPPHRFRPEIAAAADSGEGWHIRTSDTTHENTLYHARRASLPHHGPVYIRLAVHMEQLRRGLAAFYLGTALAAAGCIIGAGLISYYVARRQVAPVLEVTHLADAIANGHLGHRILRTDPGELGLLARSLNRMTDTFADLLKEAEAGRSELQTILGGMSEGVIALDPTRRIVFANEAAGRLLNFDAPASRGRMLWEVLRREEIIKGLDEIATTDQRKQLHLGPLEGRHVEVTLCPLHRSVRGGSGAPPDGFICVLHDVTEALRYQQLRTEFVANVSHELRTPLSVIKGYIETLRDGVEDPQQRQRFMEIVDRHASQLANLVEDLLQLSRLEHGQGIPHRTSVNVALLLQRVAEFLAPVVNERGHHLRLELPPSPVDVSGNVDYLERAVGNLLDNAVKYTPEGGDICIRLGSTERDAIIEVIDSGVGIAAADIPRIFERFYRVDRSRSREMGGTGLGLSIVKHIATAHGGSVEVESTPGKGSTFRLRLPRLAS